MGFASGAAERFNGGRGLLGLGFLPADPCCCSSVQQQSQGDLCCPMGRYVEKHGACGPLP